MHDLVEQRKSYPIVHVLLSFIAPLLEVIVCSAKLKLATAADFRME
jgi:hypothetical protein